MFTGDVDIEKPTEASQPLTFYVFSDMIDNHGYVGNNHSIPIHLRYHKPRSNEEYVTVALENPQLLIKCEGRYHVESAIHCVNHYICSSLKTLCKEN